MNLEELADMLAEARKAKRWARAWKRMATRYRRRWARAKRRVHKLELEIARLHRERE